MNGKRLREKAILLLCIGLVATPHASAEAVLADIVVNIPEPRNDAEFDVAISLNGTTIPTQNQTLSLMMGDTVLVEFSGTATGFDFESEPGGGPYDSNASARVFVDFSLGAAQSSAQVQSILGINVDSGGIDAFAQGLRSYACLAVSRCMQPMSSGAPESATSGVITDASPFGDNRVIINDESMPTGRDGGPEALTVSDLFLLDPSLPGDADPLLELDSESFVSALLDGSAASATLTWELTVVPIPAAVWLFGSALGLLGWIRRKTS